MASTAVTYGDRAGHIGRVAADVARHLRTRQTEGAQGREGAVAAGRDIGRSAGGVLVERRPSECARAEVARCGRAQGWRHQGGRRGQGQHCAGAGGAVGRAPSRAGGVGDASPWVSHAAAAGRVNRLIWPSARDGHVGTCNQRRSGRASAAVGYRQQARHAGCQGQARGVGQSAAGWRPKGAAGGYIVSACCGRRNGRSIAFEDASDAGRQRNGRSGRGRGHRASKSIGRNNRNRGDRARTATAAGRYGPSAIVTQEGRGAASWGWDGVGIPSQGAVAQVQSLPPKRRTTQEIQVVCGWSNPNARHGSRHGVEHQVVARCRHAGRARAYVIGSAVNIVPVNAWGAQTNVVIACPAPSVGHQNSSVRCVCKTY